MIQSELKTAGRLRVRTQPFTYAIFGVLLGPIFLIWTALAWSNPSSSDWEGAAAAGTLLIILWLWFFVLEVDLCPDRLVLQTLLGKRELRYAEIRRVEIAVRRSRGATGRAWAIYDSAHFATRPLKIPIAPFTASDQRKIAGTLVEMAPTAHIDAWTRSVAQGE